MAEGYLRRAAALGALAGVFCGDAAGGTLEFYRRTIDVKAVQKSIRMPGGGSLCLGKGQITDDSELTIALARGLCGSCSRSCYPIEDIAREYGRWYESEPFDVGNTCGLAFSVSSGTNLAARMMNMAMTRSAASEANGALMRVVPIAIWAHRKSPDVVARHARSDAMLSHPSPVCQSANVLYCLAIAYLLNHPGDGYGAIAHIQEYLRTAAGAAEIDAKVRRWFEVDSVDISGLGDCTQQIGHVRWAFVLAIHFLRTGESYASAISQTLIRGGDTDTNAAIVGGLIGALHGIEGIPGYMLGPVMAFDCETDDGNPRPKIYSASGYERLVDGLLAAGAT